MQYRNNNDSHNNYCGCKSDDIINTVLQHEGLLLRKYTIAVNKNQRTFFCLWFVVGGL